MATEAPTAIAVPATVRVPIVKDVYPRGDIYLVCGTNIEDERILKIRVSSAVLNLSSKVFQAMLSPRFKEGTDLLQATSASPLEIELGDDDPQAMEVICDIIHLRNSSFAATNILSPTWVLRIALIADKYDFIRALKLVSGMWLNNNSLAKLNSPPASGWYPGAVGGHLMLAASYLFRKAKGFKEFGRRLLLDCAFEITAPISQPHLEPIRDVLVVLEQERLKFQSQLADLVESEIQRCLLLRRVPGVAVCTPSCNYAGEFTMTLMENLVFLGVWPTSRIRAHSLQHSLNGFKAVKASNPTNTTKSCSTTKCQLASSLCSNFGHPPSIKEFQDQDISRRIIDEIKGPCLECFVSEGKVELAQCKHPYPS